MSAYNPCVWEDTNDCIWESTVDCVWQDWSYIVATFFRVYLNIDDRKRELNVDDRQVRLNVDDRKLGLTSE